MTGKGVPVLKQAKPNAVLLPQCLDLTASRNVLVARTCAGGLVAPHCADLLLVVLPGAPSSVLAPTVEND